MNLPELAVTNLSLTGLDWVEEVGMEAAGGVFPGWQLETARHTNRTSSADVRTFENIGLLWYWGCAGGQFSSGGTYFKIIL
jgi:hypothetical protein